MTENGKIGKINYWKFVISSNYMRIKRENAEQIMGLHTSDRMMFFMYHKEKQLFKDEYQSNFTSLNKCI
ncbi:hypothetical protein CSC3H3_11445 [Thalassospira marina]|uniref:Uncharacterized protein n=1 Tax=Thalassospira marina TaxID=2048283 RepID=A0ABM6Q9P3_9PROT|nr:hypothetical protein CSC3H3_11445 [Thalassospira marina]